MAIKRLVERLEQALCLWEDNCFMLGVISKMKTSTGITPNYQPVGPMIHYKDFRNYLLNFRGGKIDYEKFVGPNLMEDLLRTFYTYPVALLSWTINSRRVFNLPATFQAMLRETSFDDICWKELKWPFESFVVMLEDPIKFPSGNECDCIMVSEIGKLLPQKSYGSVDNYNGKAVEFRFLSTGLNDYVKTKPAEREEILRLIRQKRFDKLIKKVNRLDISQKKEKVRFYDGGVFIVLPDLIAEKEITTSLPELMKSTYGIEKGNLQEWDSAMHIVLNLCIYLANLPPKQFKEFYSNEEMEQAQNDETFDLTAITDKANICTVGREHTLSKEDQKTIAFLRGTGSGKEKRAHFRRGHWRKVSSANENSEISRIWIKPCLVNKHKLAPGSIPSGSKTLLK